MYRIFCCGIRQDRVSFAISTIDVCAVVVHIERDLYFGII